MKVINGIAQFYGLAVLGAGLAGLFFGFIEVGIRNFEAVIALICLLYVIFSICFYFFGSDSVDPKIKKIILNSGVIPFFYFLLWNAAIFSYYDRFQSPIFINGFFDDYVFQSLANVNPHPECHSQIYGLPCN